jgi:hypothetical protein
MSGTVEPRGEQALGGRIQRPGVRVRPLADVECLLAFSPVTRTLHWLNLSAWAIFDLCDGTRSDQELAAAYVEALGGDPADPDLTRPIAEALASLERSGLITAPPNQS